MCVLHDFTDEGFIIQRRLIKRAVLCFLSGLIVSLLVAWSVAILYPTHFGVSADEVTCRSDPSYCMVSRTIAYERVIRALVKPEQVSFFKPSDAPYWSLMRRCDWRRTRAIVEDARGWPMRCLMSWYQLRGHDMDVPGQFELRGGFQWRKRQRGSFVWYPLDHVLPLRPIWPGLVANSFFYGGIFFTTPLLFGIGRAALRRKCGLCGACGYDISDLIADRCPECGQSIHRK